MPRRRLRVLAALAAALAASGWAGAAASAVEVEPGFDVRGAYDTNVFNADRGQEEDDILFFGGPDLAIRDRRRNFDYELSYQLRYEAFREFSEIDDFQHFARADANWRIAPRSELSFSNFLTRTSTANQLFLAGTPVTPGAPVPGVIELGRQDVLVNQGDLTLTHRLTGRSQVISTVDGGYFRYPDGNQFDSLSTRGVSQYTYALSPKLVVGGGVSILRQDFGEVEGVEGRGSMFYQGFASLNYSITPSLTLVLSGGPAWSVPEELDTDQRDEEFVVPETPVRLRVVGTTVGFFPIDAASCGTLGDEAILTSSCGTLERATDLTDGALVPVSIRTQSVPLRRITFEDDLTPDPSLTYFGRASLEKQWEHAQGALQYERSASSASGVGSSTNLDTFTGRFSWRPTRKWNLSMLASYERQTLGSEQQIPAGSLVTVVPGTLFVDSFGNVLPDAAGARFRYDGAAFVGEPLASLDTDVLFTTLRVDLQATRSFTRTLSGVARASWWWQETERDVGDESTRSDRRDFRFELGFTWTLDPIEL